MADGLSNLFQNKLFLQYLAAAGQDIGSGKPLGTNVNAVTSQAITTQNFNKLLAKILGEGGKLTMDKEKFNMSGPSTLFGGTQGMRDVASQQLTGISSIEPIGGAPNPFRIAL